MYEGSFYVFFTFFIGVLPILVISTTASIFSEKSGIINIGINGIMIFGAIGYILFAHIFSSGQKASAWTEIPLLGISTIFGIVLGLLFGYAVIKLKANQIVAGIALNILAPALVWIIRIANKAFTGSTDLSYTIPELAVGPSNLNSPFNIFSLKILLLIIVVIVAFIALNKTKWGLRYKSVGENPAASDAAGINVSKIQWQGIIISAALAGLAGGICTSISHIIPDPGKFNGTIKGFGFLALSVMIMGRWKVLLSFGAASFFAILVSLGLALPSFSTQLETVSDLVQAVPYLITLVVLIIFAKNSIGPKSAGVPYDKSQR